MKDYSTKILTDIAWHFKNLETFDDVTRIDPEPLTLYVQNKVWKQPFDSVRYHRAPVPLRVDHTFCTFHGNAIVRYGIGTNSTSQLAKRTKLEITQPYGVTGEL